ncbi:MAG: glycosyl hydrolase family protein, partial [Spirochaetia bacterium]|nr:glycosyl hydrolase family protein [Spirochaetia bacterium]
GEIDIMEHANIQPSYTAALHTLNRSHLTSKGGWVQGKEIASANYNTQFNIYGAEWTPEQVSFHFNNQTFYTVTKNQAGGGIGSFTFIDPQPADGNYTIYQDGVDQGGRFTISAGNVSITDPGCNYDATRNVSGAFPNGARMSITSSVSCDTSDTHWPFNQPFWIKLNLAVGGSYGATPSQEAFPSTMEIDWVKVYQK